MSVIGSCAWIKYSAQTVNPESTFWVPIPGNYIAPETDCKAK
jgi:hypothetical protein